MTTSKLRQKRHDGALLRQMAQFAGTVKNRANNQATKE
jgi:hypothetical protein